MKFAILQRIVRGFADQMPNGTSNFRAALVEAFTLLNIVRRLTLPLLLSPVMITN